MLYLTYPALPSLKGVMSKLRNFRFEIVGILVLAIVLAIFVWVTDMPSYITSSPRTCTNCHVMDAAYENWYHAPHEKVTKCVDCHLPHENMLAYYYVKFESGAHDVFYFSTGLTPDAIRLRPGTPKIIQSNCIRCHSETVSEISAHTLDRNCWSCHRDVAHGERGITLLPIQDSTLYQVEEKRGIE